jgi:tetratricopeptide (TPR) repeat protein
MKSIAHALETAAGTLQSISDSTSGERARRASVVALVLRGAERVLAGGVSCAFTARRTAAELESLPRGSERSLLRRIARLGEAVAENGAVDRLAEVLVQYGCELETGRRMDEAKAVMALARGLAPASAEVALHAARVARRAGDREEALALYRAARSLDGEDGGIGRLARIGEAVVSPHGERLISGVVRAAIVAGDAEAAAVALEERALLRRAGGDREGAARDLCFSAWRFTDPVDRARVAHRLADLFIATDDPRAAREALLLALAVGDESQQEHARSRLHTVSRDLGDQVGQRRWRSFRRASLVSLSARPRTPVGESAAPRLAEWREGIERQRVAASSPAPAVR